ncbi:IS1595 family transposase [Chondrinema litorale]|uniref:IS1595 family transposase n=1 Tax=Chondrinema litorale TaxID=2994555 RepID=UPI0025428E16|nr:IS1595 family transposase [Chondrinema litorale]UZR98120.1 IS1595 family transposase [Chondrinema litorale]
MKIDKGLTEKAFKKRFGTKEQCLAYLHDQKWSDGYHCRKCRHTTFCKGKQDFSKRCTACGYDESATAHTLFHKLKFGIDTAFAMVYEIVTNKKGANSIHLAQRFGVRQTTAWLFRRKVQQAMSSSKKFPLVDQVHVDEFEIGTPQEGEQGRSHSYKKVRVVIAIEYREGNAGRGYAQPIKDYSAKSLNPIFKDHISKKAAIVTDGWSGYKPIKKLYKNMRSQLSNKGENFTMLHLQIRNLKNWLRGTHSYCDKRLLNDYLNEYFFRFNRRNFRETILDKLLERMVEAKSKTYSQIICAAT